MIKLSFYDIFRRTTAALMTFMFVINSVGIPHAQAAADLPQPGQMLGLSPAAAPAMLRGFTIDPLDPFSFEFLVDRGQAELTPDQKKDEYEKLIKYFLASLAIPEEDLWVNLSPYESDRIIADNFGLTAMGRDLLAQDYILKQITASLIHPDSEPGRAFWAKVYKTAAEKFGTTNIPVDTFNKVWIVPDDAEVYASGLSVVLVKSRLKVMLESDYLAMSNNVLPTRGHGAEGSVSPSTLPSDQALNVQATEGSSPLPSELTKNIMREIILPILEKEVNEGAHFAAVRQITSALILATWYKKQWAERLLNPVYSDRSKVKGIDQDPANNTAIYQQYVEAFKRGVFNFIREESDEFSREPMPRKYFSGGYATRKDDKPLSERITRRATPPTGADFAEGDSVKVKLSNIMDIFRRNRASHEDVQEKFYRYWSLVEQEARGSGRPVSVGPDAWPSRVRGMFTSYFRDHLGALVLNGDYPALHSILKDEQLEGQDSFDIIADALRRELPPLYEALDKNRLDREGEARLSRLVFDTVRLVQNIIMDRTHFRPSTSSMTDILAGVGWNSSSLAMMTLLVGDILGVRELSVVEVESDEMDEDYQKLVYPDLEVAHYVNLVRVDDQHFIFDEGHETDPSTVLVITREGKLFAADRDDLQLSRAFGLDIPRLIKYLGVAQVITDIEKTVALEMTESSFLADQARYRERNKEIRQDLERINRAHRELFWTTALRDRYQDLLQTQLRPDRWVDKDDWREIAKARGVVMKELEDFSRAARNMKDIAFNKKDPVTFRRAAHRYRVVSEMTASVAEVSKKYVTNKELVRDEETYAAWEKAMDEFERGISQDRNTAEDLDILSRFHAARWEVEQRVKELRPFREKNDIVGLQRAYDDLHARVELFIATFEKMEQDSGGKSAIDFRGLIMPFVKIKENVASDIELLWDVTLDNYNEARKGSSDKSQAEDPLGGIDLDPSRFNINVRGDPSMFAEVPAADAVKIEGLVPQIISITPGDGFLKRFAIK